MTRWTLCASLQGLETDDEVVGEPDHEGAPPTPGLDGFHEPFVQHLVEVDVAQKRRDDAALRRPFPGVAHSPPVPYARLQPLGYQAVDHPVSYPAAQQLAHLAMPDVVEEPADVHLEDPPDVLLEALLPQVVEGLVLRAPGPEAEGERQELLLVDRFQDHGHRTLEDLVLHRR